MEKDYLEEDRKQNELTLSQSENLYRSIVEHLSDVMILHDVGGRIQEVNKAAVDHIGISREQLKTMSVFDLHMFQADPEMMIDYWKAWPQGQIVDDLKLNLMPNGQTIYEEIRAQKIISGDKEFIFALSRDVTLKKNAEVKLQESNERLLTVMESIDALIYISDMETYDLLFVNAYGKRIWGENIVGQKCYKALQNKDWPCDFCTNKYLLDQNGQPSGIYSWEFKNPLSEAWYDIKDRAVLWSNGRIVRMEIATDISHRKEIERNLKLAIDEAETANRMKSQFLSNMSHEIRTPMNGVLGMLQLLQQTDLSEDQAQYVKISKESSEALLVIINDILDYSKIESGKVELVRQVFNPARMVEDIQRFFSVAVAEKGLILKTYCESRLPTVVVGDPFRLRQVLINLIGNAIKFTHSGSVEIRVTTTTNPKDGMINLLFSVVDTGIGIEDNAIDALFERFTQQDGAQSRRYGGTGLGLAITKGLVALMHGEIWVKSKVGKGSEFHVLIPFDLTENIMETASNISEDVPHQSTGPKFNGLILLVEDDFISQKVATTFLKKLGFTVDLATNGLEAVFKFQNKVYDGILMDISLPEMDGYLATAEIRKIERNRTVKCPIIALTANAISGDMEKCLNAGMDAYLAKPLNLDIFIETLGNLLSNNKV